MKLQYGALSAQVAGGRQGNYGKWQMEKKRRRIWGPLEGLLGALIWVTCRFVQENIRFLLLPVVRKKMLRLTLVMVFLAAAANVLCFQCIEGIEREMALVAEKQAAAETTNIALLARRAMAWGPDNLQQLAAEKLHLAPATKGQVAVYDRSRSLFR